MENRKREQEMELALKTLKQIDKQAYETYYQTIHNDLLENILKEMQSENSSESEEAATTIYKFRPQQAKLQCRSCSRELFTGEINF